MSEHESAQARHQARREAISAEIRELERELDKLLTAGRLNEFGTDDDQDKAEEIRGDIKTKQAELKAIEEETAGPREVF